MNRIRVVPPNLGYCLSCIEVLSSEARRSNTAGLSNRANEIDMAGRRYPDGGAANLPDHRVQHQFCAKLARVRGICSDSLASSWAVHFTCHCL